VPTTARSAGECTSNRAYMSGDGDTLGACRRAGYLPLLDGEQGAALA